jgi:hypothetical protein
MGHERKPRPTTPWRTLPLEVVCPACRLQLGRCADEDTRQIALHTHALGCPAQNVRVIT